MAEPISIQQLKDASEDAITLADFIYKPANVMIPRRLAADINSLQYYLDYMSSYAQRSYETYDEMVANAVNLPNGVSAFVTNDLDVTKNGIYTYNGVSFVKGDYQPENAAKEFVEAKIDALPFEDGSLAARHVVDNSGELQQDINNITYGNLNIVDKWGIVGDGVTDESIKIQAAIDELSSIWLSTGVMQTLAFAANKTYVLSACTMRAGVNYSTYGLGKATLLKKPALVGDTEASLKWRRIFSSDSTITTKAPNLRHTISNLVFDGNINNLNWTRGSYSQEQGTSLIITASSGVSENDRVCFELNNVDFKTSVADGVTVHINADIVLNNCTGDECFRGGVTVVGGNSRAIINNWRGENANIHIEIDGNTPWGYKTDVTVNGGVVDKNNQDTASWGGYTAHVLDGGTVTYNNFTCYSGNLYIFACNANENNQITFNNCTLAWKGGVGYLMPKLVEFNNCVFNLKSEINTGAVSHGFSGTWYIASREPVIGSKLIFNGGRAIATYTEDSERGSFVRMNIGGVTEDAVNNPYKSVVFTGGFYIEGFLRPYSTIYGGHIVDYEDIKVNTPFFIDAAMSGTLMGAGARIRIGKVDVGEKVTTFIKTQNLHDVSIMSFNNTVVPLSKFNSSTGVQAAFFDYEGQLTLTTNSKEGLVLSSITAPPNTRLLIKNAGKGEVCEYINYAESFSGSKSRFSNKWVFSKNNIASFTTENLPVLTVSDAGCQNIDTTLNKVVTWTGTAWV